MRGVVKMGRCRPHTVTNFITGLNIDAGDVMGCHAKFRRHFLDALHDLPQEASNVNIYGGLGSFPSDCIECYLFFGIEKLSL